MISTNVIKASEVLSILFTLNQRKQQSLTRIVKPEVENSEKNRLLNGLKDLSCLHKLRVMLKLFATIFLSLFLFVYGTGQSAEAFKQKIETWQKSPLLANAGIGIAVYDATSGEALLRSDPQLSLVPASIFKVVTTSTALEVFGPDYRFKTTLAYSGTIKNDTLWGDLLVTGGGDPTLGSSYFPETKGFLSEWAKALVSNHIRVVKGHLIVDSSIYEKVQVPDSWAWEDLGSYYGAGASGLSVFDNVFEIHLKSPQNVGQPTKVIKTDPEIPGLELQNEVRSADINDDQSYVFGNPEDSRRVIRGIIPKGRNDFVVKASIPDPATVLSSEFRARLRKFGVEIAGNTVYEKVNSGNAILKETLSPPLSEIIKLTNHESINLFAEHLLKHLAWKKDGLGTTKGGCQFIQDFWKEKGLPMEGFFMNDGSGLSRFDAITTDQMCRILNFMRSGSNSEVFLKSLPMAGYGTLTAFSPENFPDGCLHAKSGSMTRVRCYAGYLKTTSGKQISFAIMLNNFSCTMKEATRKIEELLVEFRKI
jgi:D-alanyl-D-alanine carboxypeptidase, serine-type, PBP4 family